MSTGVKEKTKAAYEKLKELGRVSNIMETPKLEKIVVSVGAGRSKDDKRKLAVIE